MYPSFNLAAPPTPAIDELAIGGVRLESYYVHQLCSPTRTALLSSRFAYSIGMDDSVIVDGVDSDLELNLKTMARPALLLVLGSWDNFQGPSQTRMRHSAC